MNIVWIESERDASGVFAALQSIGEAWRPAEDLPCLVYLEAGSLEEIRRIPGVAACWRGRTGPIARLLHASACLRRAGNISGAPTARVASAVGEVVQ